MTLLRTAAVVTIASALWSTTARAEDDRSLSILPFTGVRSEQFHDRVEKALSIWGYRLADDKRAPSSDATEPELAAFAERQDVDALISGQVTNDGTAWILDVQVRSGEDGKTIDSVRLTSPWMPGLLRRIEKDLVKNVRPLVDEAFDPQLRAEANARREQARAAEAQRAVLSPASSTEAPPAVTDSASVQQASLNLDSPRADSPAFDALMASLNDEPEPEKKKPVDRLAPASPDLLLGLRGGYLQRSMSASSAQNPQGEFRGQDGAFPTLSLSAGAYLGLLGVDSYLSNLGLEGEFEQSLGGNADFEFEDAQTVQTTSVSSSLTSFAIGPRLRIPLVAKRAEVGVAVQAGRQRMALGFDAAPNAAPERSLGPAGVGGAPDVNYAFIRVGGDGKYRFGAFSVDGAVAYRLVTNPGNGPGEIAGDVNQAGEPAFFPNDEVNGVDGALTLAYQLLQNLELRLGADARVYVHDFNFTPQSQITLTGRRPVASGATDAYYRGSLGLAWSPVL